MSEICENCKKEIKDDEKTFIIEITESTSECIRSVRNYVLCEKCYVEKYGDKNIKTGFSVTKDYNDYNSRMYEG
jgi:hypothetical protein